MFKVEITKSDSQSAIEEDVTSSFISFFTRVNRYGIASTRAGSDDKIVASKFFRSELERLNLRMHGSYPPRAVRDAMIGKTFTVPVTTLLGQHHFAFQLTYQKTLVFMGVRISSLPSPHGRYYMAINDDEVAKKKYGKPILMLVKSHCLLRMKERGGYDTLDALSALVQPIMFDNIIESDEEEVHINIGSEGRSVKINAANMEVTRTQDNEANTESFFVVVCYTYF
jgi:hypothetical protein